MFPNAQNLPHLWVPMIPVALSNSQHPAPPNVIEHNLVALLDTGADFCRIDTALARANLQSKGTMPSVAGGVQTMVNVYRAQLITEEGNVLDTDLFESPLRSAGSQFDFLIGMEMLRFFRIEMNRKINLMSLTWVGP
jgi:hypothetical protein